MNFNHDIGTIDSIIAIDTTPTLPGPGGGGGLATNILTIIGTGALGLPSGNNTTDRPSSPVGGYLRYNSTSAVLEYWNGSGWQTVGTSSATGTVTSITATQSGAGISLVATATNPITTSGTITASLSTDLSAFATSITGNGLYVRTGSATFAQATFANGTGISWSANTFAAGSSITANLTAVGSAVTDQFVKITTNASGQVSATTAVSSANIITALGSTWALGSAITITGGAIDMGANKITTTYVPVNGPDLVNKTYVDNLASGIDVRASCKLSTTANITIATALATGASFDGVTLVSQDRVLVKNQTTQSENGIYTIAVSGAPSRSTDMDAWTEFPGAFVWVEQGANADTGWVCTVDQGGTLNTTAVTWTQFSGSGIITNLANVTGTLAVGNGGTGATTFTANGVLYGNTTSAIQVTAQGGANTVLTANTGAPVFSATPTVTSLTTTGLISVGSTATVTTSVSSPSYISTAALAITAGSTLALTSASAQSASFDSGTTGAINIGITSSAKTITIGNATSSTGLIVNTGTAGALFNLVGAGIFKIAATAAPTTDMVQITNATQAVATTGVSNLDLNYVLGTLGASSENSSQRITITHGTPSSTSIVNGLRITSAGSSVAGFVNNGIKIDAITGGAATENAFFVGTGWDNVLSYNGTAVINGTGQVVLGAVSGTLAVANGGTGATTFTSNGVLLGNTTSAITATAAGGAGTIFAGNAGAPAFTATPSGLTSLGTGTLAVGTTATVGTTLAVTTSVTSPSYSTASGAGTYSATTTASYSSGTGTTIGATTGNISIAPTAAGGTVTITAGSTAALTLDSGSTSGAINLGTNANAKTITIGNVTGATALVVNTGTGGTIFNTVAAGFVRVAASAPPTVDMVQITNSGQAVASAGVNALSINYTGGAGAIESSANEITLTPGGTSGSTWSGIRIIGNTAASGVTENAIKIDAITGGAGTENALFVGTGWDNVLSYNGTAVINGTGQVVLGAVSGTLAVANGGTGATTLTSNGVLLGNTTSAITATAAGGAGTILAGSAGAPSFTATPTGLTSLGAGTLNITSQINCPSYTTTSGAASYTAFTTATYSSATGTTLTSAAGGTLVRSANATGIDITTGTTGTLTLDTGTLGPINIGTNSSSKTVTIGSVTSSLTNVVINAIGGVAINVNNSNYSLANPFTSGTNDAAELKYILRATTTDATAGVELFLNGATGTTRATLPNTSVWAFSILLAARRTDATGTSAGYKFEGVIKRDATAGTTALIGAVAKTVLAETNAALNADVTANTTNGSLKVAVTGLAASTIRWVANITVTQVLN